jgi:hypothetical protein
MKRISEIKREKVTEAEGKGCDLIRRIRKTVTKTTLSFIMSVSPY